MTSPCATPYFLTSLFGLAKGGLQYSKLQGQAEQCWAAGRLSVTAVNTAVPVFVNDVLCVEWGSGLGVDYVPKQGNGLKGWVTAVSIGFSSWTPWQQ